MEFFDFDDAFLALTGNRRLSWQKRLYVQHFEHGKLDSCSVIDIPTGLGKTMVMAIWLIARAHKARVPTRLIYVVDRRTVVDQASDLARKLRDNCKHTLGIDPPAISTLRGQLADNREWSKDPSRPAIIIGTVDLIGSGLLFSAYRSSYKRRPLEAGLLGQDSLLVLDEAHLSKPFDTLLGAIEQFSTSHDREGAVAGVTPLRVIRMSATSGNAKEGVFRLDTDPNSTAFDLWSEHDENGNEKNPIKTRFEAKKTLTLVELENPLEAIAIEADKLATQMPGSRIVIFVRTPTQVADIRKALEKKNKSHATRIAQLTGTMRGLERDELVDTETPLGQNDHERRVMQRFLNPDNDTSQGACFLISTSAGEVGFDLNADHMVCDATTIDSFIQRLGRVNRRGNGDAQIHLFVEPLRKEKKGKPTKLVGLDLAIANTIELLQKVEDVSPKNIAASKADTWKDKYADACSPVPTMVELSDILLDTWSMTSITEPMPGRPEVGPWLRGIAEWEPPQTTIAWRAELDESGFGDLDLDEIEEWFDAHRVLAHETLSVPTSDVAAWLVKRWDALSPDIRADLANKSCVIELAGLRTLQMENLINDLRRKPKADTSSIRSADLILPASFGGIRRGIGLLDHEYPKLPALADFASDDAPQKAREQALAEPDVADERPLSNGVRRREILDLGDESAEPKPLTAKPISETVRRTHAKLRVEWPIDNDRWKRLISYVPKRDKLESGTKIQTLAEHVGLVRQRMDELFNRLDLSETIKMAARLAAEWHDHGKNRERWQRTVNGAATVGSTDWQKQLKLEGKGEHQCLGKSGGMMKRDPRGYRHEFGSLREFTDALKAEKVPDDVFDLAMHLIATHHGRGRPHFPKGGFDPDCEGQSDQIHTDSIRRFARLQRKYGWWHLAWLENLLRCADALASADQDAEADSADLEGGTA